MIYFYPLILNGYRFNLLRRCQIALDLIPIVGEFEGQTFLEFEFELSPAQKLILDNLMATNPQNPPPFGVQLRIRDLYGDIVNGANFQTFKENVGLPNLNIFYVESIPDSGFFDQIALWNPTAITTDQENAIKQAYFNLFIG
jgi:hypothetical protein